MAKRKAPKGKPKGKKTGKTAGKKKALRPARSSVRRKGTKKRATASRTAARRPARPRRAAVVKSKRSAVSARKRTAAPVNRLAPRKPAARKAAPRDSATIPKVPGKAPRLDRVRRTLEDTVQTPPSSLDMVRRGTAARTGRAEMAQSQHDHSTMGRAIAGGDVDVDIEDAYFTGEEAPGGDNPTPDQDIVDDIGRALGVEYQDNEELKAADKVSERDRNRWELDPASAEDYKDRK